MGTTSSRTVVWGATLNRRKVRWGQCVGVGVWCRLGLARESRLEVVDLDF